MARRCACGRKLKPGEGYAGREWIRRAWRKVIRCVDCHEREVRMTFVHEQGKPVPWR